MGHYRKLPGGSVRVWLDDEDDAIVASRDTDGTWGLTRVSRDGRFPLSGRYGDVKEAMEGALRELRKEPSDIDDAAQDLGLADADDEEDDTPF